MGVACRPPTPEIPWRSRCPPACLCWPRDWIAPRQPATLATGFLFLFQAQTRSSVCGLNVKKRQTRQKKARFPDAGLGTVAGLGCRAPKRSGGLKGRPRNTGTCSDLQGQPCRGFKWHPAAAVSSGRSAGLLRKPGPVHHVDPGWPGPNQLDLLSSEVEVTTLYSVPMEAWVGLCIPATIITPHSGGRVAIRT